MAKTKLFGSLKTRIQAFILALFAAVALLLLYNNYFAADIIRNKLYLTVSEVLQVSQKRLNDAFRRSSSFLATFIYEQVDIKTLEKGKVHSTAYHNAIERISRQFSSSLPSQIVDSFFYYEPDSRLFIANQNTISTPMRGVLSGLNRQQLDVATRRWIAVASNESHYLIRVTRVSSSYLGAWLEVSAAMKLVAEDQLSDSRLLLLDLNGRTLSGNREPMQVDLKKLAGKAGPAFLQLDGERWLATLQRAIFGEFYLLSLSGDASVTGSLNHLFIVMFAAAVFAFLITTAGATTLQRWILRPIRQLTTSIRALQEGDFETSLPEGTLAEFHEVNVAFNIATSKIEQLKIDVYEGRLKNQEIMLQFLQLQLPPHFLLNCLNTIYHLTQIDQPETTRLMIRQLSDHLRYTLTSAKTVRLQEELRFVENFIGISNIRYPGSVLLISDYDPDVMDATIIPFLLLNFIENSIKFEVQPGKQLELHLSTRLRQEKGVPALHICIWDTGDGFGKEILARLQDVRVYLEKHPSDHVGISNVIRRAQIMYPQSAFRFSNRVEAGAQIDILIPYHTGQRLED